MQQSAMWPALLLPPSCANRTWPGKVRVLTLHFVVNRLLCILAGSATVCFYENRQVSRGNHHRVNGYTNRGIGVDLVAPATSERDGVKPILSSLSFGLLSNLGHWNCSCGHVQMPFLPRLVFRLPRPRPRGSPHRTSRMGILQPCLPLRRPISTLKIFGCLLGDTSSSPASFAVVLGLSLIGVHRRLPCGGHLPKRRGHCARLQR